MPGIVASTAQLIAIATRPTSVTTEAAAPTIAPICIALERRRRYGMMLARTVGS
jgi:hypothetical protein